MSKRELTEEEKKLASKGLESMSDDLEYLAKVMLPKKQLAVDTADIEFNRQVKELKKELKQLVNKKEELEGSIATLQDQIDNGVEIIEKDE